MCDDLFTITEISVQVKNKNRFSIFLDGEFAFGIHQDVLLKSGIAQGDKLSTKQIDEIKSLEELKKAKDKAIRLLSVRARSTKELSDRLKQAKIPGEIIEHVINELERLDLLDDRKFGEMYARTRMVTRPCGPFLLRQELKQKGLLDKDIEHAVSIAYEEKSVEQFAHELAIKNKRKTTRYEDIQQKKKTSDFLMRRGFSWDIVKNILDDWESLET